MKLIIRDDKLEIELSKAINSGSINYYNIECEFNSAWNGLTKEIILKSNNNAVKRIVVDGIVNIDQQIKGIYQIGAKGYSITYTLTTDTTVNPNKTYYTRTGTEESYVYSKVENPTQAGLSTYYEAEKTLQISTGLKRIPVNEGAGEIETTDEGIPTPTEFESYIHQIQTVVQQASNLNIVSKRVSDGVEITFTSKQGIDTVRKVNDGEKGDKGDKGDSGVGVKAGGTTGQVLKKKTNNDYDTEWADETGGGVKNHNELNNLDYASSGHTGFQATISDLDTIRTGASKGMTAIQEHQSLANYSLIAETGNKIDLSIDNSTYIMTLILKDKNNNALSTGTIDLPLETMVVGATYDNVNKKIVLTLKNGQTLDVPVGDLVNGLATQTALNEEITNRQNADNLKENIFRYSTMPTASASNVGNIVEYIGTTDSNYTKGYFYENINTEVQESITASQTDNGVPLGTITLNNNTLKSQLNAGTHEFYYRPYDTVLNFSNISVFPPVMIQVTRDSTFDIQPMIPNAPKMYSWVDNSNNFYATDTLQPNALTKLYSLDIQTNDLTDTGATFISSNTPSQIEGRWTKNTGDVYEDVELSDYGILLSSSGLPGNTISVTYVQANTSYSWQQKNVQPSSGGGTSNYNDLTNKPTINNVELSGNKSASDLSLQSTLVSGTNIKTINNNSILGSGDITISGGSENWELINTVTVTEDVQNILINQDTNNNGFELKKIFLVVTTKPSTGAPSTRYNMRVYTGSYSTRKQVSSTDNIVTKQQAFIGATENFMLQINLESYIRVGSTVYTGATLIGEAIMSGYNPKPSREIASRLLLNGYTFVELEAVNASSIFGVGSEIKLYGVRV